MFIGHFGVGFGAKAAAPHTSLGLLFLAAGCVSKEKTMSNPEVPAGNNDAEA